MQHPITPAILNAADQVEHDLGRLDVSTRALLQLLRAGDTGEPPAFTPASISGLRLWLDASDASTITQSGGAVSTWTSKDASARAFTQSDAGLRPTTNASTQNSLNVIDFAGDYLDSTAAASVWKFMTDGTKHTVFAVVKFGVVANPDARYDLYSTGQVTTGVVSHTLLFDDRSSLSRNDRLVVRAYNGTAAIASVTTADNAAPANTFVLVQHTTDFANATAASRSSVTVDGGTPTANNVDTATPSASNPAATLRIGAEAAVGTSNILTGAIAEMLIYEADLSAGDVTAIEAYLATKWGITL